MALRRHVDGAGQRRGGQRVEHPDRTCHRDRCRLGQRQLFAERVVDEHAVAHAQLAPRRLAEPETDPHGRGGGWQQACRDRVVEPDDGNPAVQHAGLVARVGVHRAVPVEVVLGDVEHHTGLRAQRRRPVQLEARQLDGQQLGRLIQDVEHWVADVAAQQRPAAGGHQHRVQHRRRGGLAVGAGHHKPAPRRPVAAGIVQAPSQFDVAPDRYPGRGGSDQHRRGGRQAGAGDDEVELGDLFGGVGWIDHRDTVLREGRQRRRAVVGERGTRAERRQRGKNGATGDARTGDQDGGS